MNVLSQGLRKLSSDRSYAWSLPVTWQRWRSHHSIRHNRKPHATRKPPDAVFYRTGVICDRSLHCGNRNFDCFAIVPLTWTRRPSYRNCTRTLCRYTVCANIKFLCQGFRKLSSDRHTDIQTS